MARSTYLFVWFALDTMMLVSCRLPRNADTRYARSGDVIIGGLFPFRWRASGGACSSAVSPWAMEHSQTMIFAIEEINNDTSLLPHCVVGFDIRNNCGSEEVTLHSAVSLASGQNPDRADAAVGIIGPASSVSAVFAGKVANLYEVPIISYSATSNELSNRERFPYFLRTVPPDKLQARAMVDLLLHYGWSYVNLLYSADTYGIHGALEVSKLAEQHGICIAFAAALRGKPSAAETADVVSKLDFFRKATAVVIFSYSTRIYAVLKAFHAAHPDRRLICIGSDAFSGQRLASYGLADATIGSFFVTYMQTEIPRFEGYFHQLYRQANPDENALSPWLAEYVETWARQRNCSDLARCPVDIGGDKSTAYAAVYAFAHALHNLLQRSRDDSCNVTGKELLAHLMNVSFESVDGRVRFDAEGSSGGQYKLRNLQLSPRGIFERVEVGRWASSDAGAGGHLVISDGAVQWPLGRRRPPSSECREACLPGAIPVPLEQKCCWGCRKCPADAIVVGGSACKRCPPTLWPDPDRSACTPIVPTSLEWRDGTSLVIIAVSVVGIASTAVTSLGLLSYRQHSLIKASSRELSAVNLVGLTVAFAGVFLLFIRPSVQVCALSESAMALSFTLIYAPTMLKVNRIFRIFQASRMSVRRPRFVGPKHQVLIVFVFIAMQVLLSVLSTVLDPSHPQLLIPPELAHYVELYCSFGKGSIVVVAYNVCILLTCCYYAIKARKVPSNYNESKFIAVSVYSTLIMFLAVIPVYSTAVAVLQRVATLAVALQVNAFVTLALVYWPKIYGIHFGHDLNVQEWRTTTSNATGNQVGTGSEGVKPASLAMKQSVENAGTSLSLPQ